jgi:hypothetical protein
MRLKRLLPIVLLSFQRPRACGAQRRGHAVPTSNVEAAAAQYSQNVVIRGKCHAITTNCADRRRFIVILSLPSESAITCCIGLLFFCFECKIEYWSDSIW